MVDSTCVAQKESIGDTKRSTGMGGRPLYLLDGDTSPHQR